MKNRMAVLLGLMLLTPVLLAANLPIINANVETQQAEPRLERQIERLVKRGQEPVWIAYQTPIVDNQRLGCFGESKRDCRCHLEQNKEHFNFQDLERGEIAGNLLIFMRAERGAIHRIRVFSEFCEIDAGGKKVYELVGVDPAKSLAMLAGWIERDDQSITDETMAALALHADPLADNYLEGFVSEGNTFEVREKAIFWAGNARGRAGFEILRDLNSRERNPDIREKITFGLHVNNMTEARDLLMNMARSDESGKVRGQALFWLAQHGGAEVAALIDQVLANGVSDSEMEQAIFSLSQMPEEQGLDRLIEIARSHENSKARERALFWLGQKAGARAVAAIGQAIEDDPEIEVKKQAVFALSQLPKNEGVPLLLKIARTHPRPEVRKQAFFWLGQSGAKEALALFEEVLDQ